MTGADPLETIVHHAMSEFRLVAFTTQMAEIQVTQVSGHDVFDRIRTGLIGKMTVTAQDPLFQTPRTSRTFLKHFHVVVGFEHQCVGMAYAFADQSCEMAEVGGKTNVPRRGAQDKANRVLRIMRDAEGLNGNIADFKTRARGKEVKLRSQPENTFDFVLGVAVAIHRDPQLISQADESADMVGMLMSGQNSRKVFWSATDAGHPQADLPWAEPGVHQNTNLAGFHVGAIAGRTAPEDG